VKGGQDVRLLEIPADRGHGVGAFDKPKTKAAAAAFAEKVDAGSKRAYGTAGPEFERCIIAAGVEEIAARVQGEVDAFIKAYVKAGANEQVHRAAKTFALNASAGELMIEFEIAPWDKGEALAAAEWALKQWIAVRGGTGSSEAKRQIAQIRELIGRRRFDGFASPTPSPDGSIPDQRTIHDCAGYSVGKGDAEEWWFTVEQWKSACRGYDPNKVAGNLDAAGKRMRRGNFSVASPCWAKRRAFAL
jgi:putative DNA primase/helicase